MAQLQQQQQQLVAQMQMTQQALMLGQSMEAEAAAATAATAAAKERFQPSGRERHLSENYGSTGSSDGSLKENRPDNNNGELLPATGVKTEFNGKKLGKHLHLESGHFL